MKVTHFIFIAFFSFQTLWACASSKSQKINSETKRLKGCPLASGLELAINPENSLQVKMGKRSLLEIKRENYQEEVISGTTPDAKQCFIAVKNAESQVNESYSLFIFSAENETIKPSHVTTITNPDFTENRILTSYREAARWHYDSLCYSDVSKDYYTCEKREEIFEGLEKRQECNLEKCESIRISMKGKPDATARIKSKTYLYREHNGELTESKSYLIAGDNISLMDFKETKQAAYFKVQFKGKVIGWVEESSIMVQ